MFNSILSNMEMQISKLKAKGEEYIQDEAIHSPISFFLVFTLHHNVNSLSSRTTSCSLCSLTGA